MTPLHVVVVHPYAVHRRAVGGTTRVFAFVRHLVGRGHRVTIFAHADEAQPDADAAACRELAAMGVTQQVFARPRPSRARRLAWAVGRVPYHVARNRNPELEAALASLARDSAMDAVHMEFGYLADLLPPPGSAVYGLAEQEVMSIARARLAGVPFRERTWYQRAAVYTAGRVRTFERRTLPRFDLMFGITDGEARTLAALAGREVGVLPHLVDVGRFALAPGTSRHRERLLFVGNYGHAPNEHAVRWFAHTVWPLVKAARPSASWVVAGPGLGPALRAQLIASGAQVAGFVDDLPRLYAECAVFVNPVRSGGGMRGKVLEAMAAGAPVVSTTVGLEGIGGVPGRHHRVADAAEPFAAEVLDLLVDETARRAMAAAAHALVLEAYDAPRVCGRLEAAYAEAVQRHRGGVQGERCA